MAVHSFIPLLEAEQKEDEAILRERLGSWSVEKLEHQGYCLTDMRAYWQEEMQFGKPVATFLLGPGIALPVQHRFEYVPSSFLPSCVSSLHAHAQISPQKRHTNTCHQV